MSNNTNTQIDLIKELDKNKQSENIVFSPIGIEMVLSLLSNGAEGRTQKEILDFLNYKSLEEANEKSKEIKDELEKNSEIIKMANAILTKEKAKEPFIKTGKEKYDANIEVLDNYRNVNEWARNKTKNNINKIIDSIHPDVIMVLLNALYFDAFWEIKFDQNDSKFQPFYNFEEEKNKVNITMMILRGTLLNYYENDYFQAVKLNYQKPGSFNSIIILPKKDYGINNLISQFDSKEYEKLIEGLKKKEKVNLFLPKFELEFKAEISDLLKSLKIVKAFGMDAEFKGICDKSPIHINQVLQKNYINVNEEGTQAASITELEVILESYKDKDPNAKDFIAERPFLFLIRDDALPKGRDILFFTKLCQFNDPDDRDF